VIAELILAAAMVGGVEYQSADVKALEADAFANPGMLWVAQGERLWNQAAASGPACASCHGDATKSMKGVAASYPKFDASLGRVVNLEGRIDACVRTNQKGSGLVPESPERLGLSAYVAYQSRGMPIVVNVEGPAQSTFDRGAALHKLRIGQMNLACTHCHDAHAGRTLLNETVSQGQPDGWPAYRLEWQSLASLQRRLRACFYGVRAEQPPYDSDDLIALELFLAHRAKGLNLSAPGVRR